MRSLGTLAAALLATTVQGRFGITDLACDPMSNERAHLYDKLKSEIITVSDWLLNPHKENQEENSLNAQKVNEMLELSRSLEYDPLGIGMSDCVIGHATLMLIVGIMSPENEYGRDGTYDVAIGFLADGPDWPQVLKSDWPFFPLLDMFAEVLTQDGYGMKVIEKDDESVGRLGCGGEPIQSIVDFLPGQNETVAARYYDDLTRENEPFPEPPTRLRPCTDMHVSRDPYSPHVCVWAEAARSSHILLERISFSFQSKMFFFFNSLKPINLNIGLDQSKSLGEGFMPERAHHAMMLVRSQLYIFIFYF